MRFYNRSDAGRRLATELLTYRLVRPIVLALPRGGVPVAAEVATTLGAPLEVFVARKIGAPSHPEFGIGAVAEGGGEPVVSDAAQSLGLRDLASDDLARRERAELDRRVQLYRDGKPLPSIVGRDVILVDDGLATGVTAEASLRALRAQGPRRLVLAVPVSSPETARRLAPLADAVVCLHTPVDFAAVGSWYDDFSQTTDEEVIELLAALRDRGDPHDPEAGPN